MATMSRATYLENSVNWASLPHELLDSIFDKLDQIPDLIQCSIVCKSWHCIALGNLKRRRAHRLPLLMIPNKSQTELYTRSLYSTIRGGFLDKQIVLPIPYNQRCCGFSHAWLSFVDETLAVNLYNPFSFHTVRLPPIANAAEVLPNDYAHDSYVLKVILSAEPDMVEDYVVVAIFGDVKRIAFCQPSSEDTKWTYIDSNDAKLLADVICHEGKVYALDNYGRVVEIDISNPYQPKLRKIIFSGFDWIWSQWGYIAELSSGDLVIARRSFRGKGEDRDRVSPKFKVWKLVFIPPNEEGERDQLVEVKDLRGDVMFVGDNHSYCVSAIEFPEVKSDCIYFTRNCISIDMPSVVIQGRKDIVGIYDLKEGIFLTHPLKNQLSKDLPSPIWILPPPQGNWI